VVINEVKDIILFFC